MAASGWREGGPNGPALTRGYSYRRAPVPVEGVTRAAVPLDAPGRRGAGSRDAA
jgi:hypothetical protein